MLWPEILDGFGTVSFVCHRANEEFVLCRNRHTEGLSIAGHIEYRFSDHRRLPDDANFRRALRQQKGFHFVILIDDPAIFRTGGGLEFNGGVHRFHVPGDRIVGVEQLLARGILCHGPLRGRDLRMPRDDRAVATAANGRQCRQKQAGSHTLYQGVSLSHTQT